jgi:hypothetical protein
MMYGSSSHFSNSIIREFNKWIDRELPNGRTVSFGSDFKLVNRNGNIGYMSKNNTIIQEINEKLINSLELETENIYEFNKAI